jgi:hypothetical protein
MANIANTNVILGKLNTCPESHERIRHLEKADRIGTYRLSLAPDYLKVNITRLS